MWNYIYFKSYIEFKDKNDYNGSESYIKSKIDQQDLSWFPIKRAKSVKEDEEIDDIKV